MENTTHRVPKWIYSFICWFSYVLRLQQNIPERGLTRLKQVSIIKRRNNKTPQHHRRKRSKSRNRRRAAKNTSSNPQTSDKEINRKLQWYLVAVVIERWVFITYFLCNTLTPLCLFGIVPHV